MVQKTRHRELDDPRSKIAVAASLYMVRRTEVRRSGCNEVDMVRLVRGLNQIK